MSNFLSIFWALTFVFFFRLDLASGETWKVITLDWPPYTDQNLPGNGIAAEALTKSMKSVGIDVEYVFMPWTRGAYEVQKSEYVGIFPSWTAKIFKGAKLSPALFHSPIGFVHHREVPHAWSNLQDLAGLRIGTVQDYQYPEEFTAMAERGVFKFLPVTSDEQNLFKVAYKRLDLTVVDLVNAKYLIETRYPDLKGLLTIDPKVYKNADLFIALKPDAHYDERFQKIKKALQKNPQQRLVESSLKTTSK